MPWPSVLSIVVLAIGADVATVWTASYDSVVGGSDVVAVTRVGVVPSAASESPPAHTPAAITANKTAAATPTGSHRAAWLSAPFPAEPREPEGRELEEVLRLPWLRLPRCAADVDLRGGGWRLFTEMAEKTRWRAPKR